jgi:hypothetical protein
MVKRRCAALLTFVLAIVTLPLSAATWYARADGGTRYSAQAHSGQCDGKADVAYPGSGTNRHCAFNDVRYMWMDGTYGNSAWVISGGDTVVIRGCAASPYQQHADAPHCRIGWDKATGNDSQNFWCAGVNAFWGCSMPPPPSGTSSQHTRILGACAYGTYTCNLVTSYPYTSNNLTQLFGGFNVGAVMYLSGSHYVDVEGLEITSHNGKCTRVGAPAYPAWCSTDLPLSDFAKWGIITTNTTSNIILQDLYIHGLATEGIGGPIGGPFTLTRVFVGFNAFAGWNFDDGHSTPDAPGSSITASHVTMEGNGCLEEYPIVHKQFPALSCWDSNSGGFGDSWSGQDTKLDSFVCDHCVMAYNTKDGFIGPHTVIHYLKITNSESYGNMGQQWKWGTSPDSTTIFENNLTVGDCRRMAEPLPGAPPGYNRHLSGFCRAAGDVFAFFAAANSTVLIANNTVVGYSATTFDLGCSPAGACNSTAFTFTNNIFLGYFLKGAEPPGLIYSEDHSVKVNASHNIEYGNRSGYACRSGDICSDPHLVNEPPQQGWTNQTFLDNFNYYPSGGSPANGHGTLITGVSSDYFGISRPNPPSIGAVEPNR